MLDWHRHKTDFRTTFLSFSTLWGNILIMAALLITLSLVNLNKVCICESLLLNPPEVVIPGCSRYIVSTNETTATIRSITTFDDHPIVTNSSSYQPVTEEKQVFYVLNLVVICLVLPLGLASIVNSLSAYWIVKVQKMKWIVRHEIDGILAISSVLSTILFSLLLSPIGVMSADLTSNHGCYFGAVMNIISSITFSIIGIPSLYLGTCNAMMLKEGMKMIRIKLREKLKQEGKSISDEKFGSEMKKMVFSIVIFLIVLTITILQFFSIWDLIFTEPFKKCFKPNEFFYTTTFLIIGQLFTLLLSMFNMCFYVVQMWMCQNLKRSCNQIIVVPDMDDGSGMEMKHLRKK